jgi:quercetin dioxygenase-like cupin family protein
MQSKTTKVIKESDNDGLPKSYAHIILEIVEYVPDSIVCKTIINNSGGKLSAVAFDKGEKFCETTTKYDTYIQIIDGKAEVTIGNKDWELKLGQGMIIPINTVHCFKAKSEFKMITTIIKHTGKTKAIVIKSN